MGSKVKLLSPELLSEEQRRYFDKYRTDAASGVCVNVLVGERPWDVRPLYLERGKVFLHRYTQPLDPDVVKRVSAEWAGFVVIPTLSMVVRSPSHLDQLLIVRPYHSKTLKESLSNRKSGGAVSDRAARLALARSIIEQVGILIKRNLVHGHISPDNIAEHEGQAVLLDPRIGILNGEHDEYTAPELVGSKSSLPSSGASGVSSDDEIPPSVDLFGLGKVLTELLGDTATTDEQQLLLQLTLPSPRQRPTFNAVEELFGVESQKSQGLKVVRGGKVIATRSDVHTSNATLLKGDEGSPESLIREKSNPKLAVVSGVTNSKSKGVFGSITWQHVGILAAAVAGTLLILERRFPQVYFELAYYVPVLASQRNPEFEVAWESGDRGRMLVVAREAILSKDPAAENAIVNQVTSGGKLPYPQLEVVKRALDPLWRDELSRKDIRAALCIGLSSLVPEGLAEVPPLSSLHPAVQFAVAGVAGARDPNVPPPGLKGVPLRGIASLPEPIGSLFATLEQSGVTLLDSPQALGLAAIAAGIPSAAAVEGYLSGATDLQTSLARMALIYPIAKVHTGIAELVVAHIRDSGGGLSEALAWFDVEPVAKWGTVSPSIRLGITLGSVTYPGLDLAQYSDLLKFPLPSVRAGAAKILTEKIFSPAASNMLSYLSGEQNKLTRAQLVALLAALALKTDAGASFVSTWFTTMHPDPTSVLLLLLSRSNLTSEDIFNLEAASFLRKVEWSATTDMLKLLASHPEPLARSLAYSRLDSTNPPEMSILQERLKIESDANLKRSIELRVGGAQKLGQPDAAPAAPQQAPGALGAAQLPSKVL